MTTTKTHNAAMLRALSDAQTIVIKVGSALVRGADNAVNMPWFNAIADDLRALQAQGKRIAIVSSGGVALGRETLGIDFTTPPSQIPLALKQAASAVGQYHMYNAYHRALAAHDIPTAQVLLTLSETENRRMYLNARATLDALMSQNIIPIINENDSISTEEIRFGDNDRLAVRTAQMIDADCVILLSTIDGLYDSNPHEDANAKHIPLVETITADHEAMAGDAIPGLSTGGMKSKIQAAINAATCGIAMIITDGQERSPLRALQSGEKKATLFKAQTSKKGARKNWISAHLKPMGEILIDDGAAKALHAGRSLLPIGVLNVSGTFERGDIVTIHDKSGHKLATGISAYTSAQAKMMAGKRASDFTEELGITGRDELVHRNDMVLVQTND
tara:strand:+ start:9967 stop:11136 length:1170 start_codon:yes stop_codon:yes gene_type:complete